MAAVQETVDRVRSIDVEAYKYGFVSPIESDMAPKGLREGLAPAEQEGRGERHQGYPHERPARLRFQDGLRPYTGYGAAGRTPRNKPRTHRLKRSHDK